MASSDILARADELLKKCAEVRGTLHYSSDGIYKWVDTGRMDGLRAACLSFLRAVFGEQHPYYSLFTLRVTSSDLSDLDSAESLIREAREEIAGGWLRKLRGLLAAEILADFTEMALHLLEGGFHDAAAVIVGSTLEEHLRQLAGGAGVDVTLNIGPDVVPKKADRLNNDLASAGVYSKLDQKSVTAWLDLRNKAAHGKYKEYSREQVALMHQGVLDFMTRHQP
jgi:hypothetical protein